MVNAKGIKQTDIIMIWKVRTCQATTDSVAYKATSAKSWTLRYWKGSRMEVSAVSDSKIIGQVIKKSTTIENIGQTIWKNHHKVHTKLPNRKDFHCHNRNNSRIIV